MSRNSCKYFAYPCNGIYMQLNIVLGHCINYKHYESTESDAGLTYLPDQHHNCYTSLKILSLKVENATYSSGNDKRRRSGTHTHGTMHVSTNFFI
jgi:hypothetical protein